MEKGNKNLTQFIHAVAVDNIFSPIVRSIDAVFTYIWIMIAAVISILLFRVLNRTEIIGQENIPTKGNVLIASNHLTMIDSFLIGTFAFFPKVVLHPDLLPYHPAAQENFFKGKIMSWMSSKWRCIPVKRGERDMFALSQMIKTLKSGTMVIFPEGTRSRTGRVGPGRVGVGKLIFDTKAIVIPTAVYGMDRVLPIGAYFPRFFQKISLVFGEPLSLDEYFALEPGVATSRLLVDRVISEISDLHSFLNLQAYLDKAQKISHPATREKEISEILSLHEKTTSELISSDQLRENQQQGNYLSKEHIH